MLPESWKERFRNLDLINTQLKVRPETFLEVLALTRKPLVVEGTSFFLRRKQYLTVYKGIAFATVSHEPLLLPDDAEVLKVRTIRHTYQSVSL